MQSERSKKKDIENSIPIGLMTPSSIAPDEKGIDWPPFLGAIQGHSIEQLDEHRMYEVLTADDCVNIPSMVHGTILKHIGDILDNGIISGNNQPRVKGLKRPVIRSILRLSQPMTVGADPE